MNLSFLMEYINLVVLGICLCLGYVIKNYIPGINNQYIPPVMLVVGTIINVLTNVPDFNAAIILGGMVSGLASTGLYETLRNLIVKDGKRVE